MTKSNCKRLIMQRCRGSFWHSLFLFWPGFLKTHRRAGWQQLPRWFKAIWQNQKNALNQGRPWLPFSATDWLNDYLRPEMNVFEWGSGGSTIHIAPLVRSLISIEHDGIWYDKVKRQLDTKKNINCTYWLKPLVDYAPAISSFPAHYFDLIIIDGRSRNACIARAVDKVKPGGYILLDNSERPEYIAGCQLLRDWPRTDFFGPGPGDFYFWQTSIFRYDK